MIERNLVELSLDELKDIKNKIERKRIITDLEYLCKEYFGMKEVFNKKLHGSVVKELKNLKKNEELFINLPRGHLKSTLTMAWIVQQIFINRNIKIALVCATNDLALSLMTGIKNYLNNERLRKLFPDILWENTKISDAVWQSDRLIVKRDENITGYTVRVGSIEGELTGQHYDIIVFDDVQAKNNSQTIFQIEKVKEGIRNCISIINKNGKIVFVGTRWRIDDVYSWVLEEFNPKKIIKSCCEDKKGKPCSVEKEGAIPIFPELFTIEELKKKKKLQGSFFFSCQYENNPLPEDTITFKESWFRFYDRQEEYKKIYILVDPALTKNKDSDDSVICVVGQPKDKSKPLQVIKAKGIDFDKSKGEIQYLVDEIFAEYSYFKNYYEVFVGIETQAFQDVLKQWIERQQTEKKLFFKVEELKPKSRSKESRIKSLQPLLENRGIEFCKDTTEKLIVQLLKYGAMTHDDYPDALAYILDVIEVENERIPMGCYSIDGNDFIDEDFDMDFIITNKKTWRDY